ncbi:kininogen-1 [Protobothrops mucrosquamatus]|uniref:kininogen-1 n=1 Tax=Protobothrops mucrosquamatus TaxID=103944 RepID=UPI0010FBA1CD|nr:kininogen-1 [Protobothrops mucrosquamatus]
MKVFILLVLSIGLCQASPLPDEVGCDDPEVFEAVARAIKALNEERNQGNKFALNVILHAYRIAGPGKKFHVVYQVRETACPIDADEPWQNCDLFGISEGLLSQHHGNCTADIDTESQDFSSISQNCKISPGQENVERSLAKCLGCWHPIDPKSLEVLPIVRFTLRQFNNQSQHFALYEIGEVNKVTRQVVNGWNYRLEYSVKETNCSKNEFPDLSPACRHLPEGREGSCTVTAHVDNTDTLVQAEQDCKVQVPIAKDSQELREPLQAAIESFNAKNNSDFHFRIVAIGEVTKQLVAGTKYRFDLTIRKTNCSKTEVEKLNEDCTAAEDGFVMIHTKALAQLMKQKQMFFWNPYFLHNPANVGNLISSSSTSSKTSLYLCAARAAIPIEGPSVAEEFHPDPRGHHIHKNRRGFGHARGHKKGHKHGHKKPKESSSEEVTVLSPVQTPNQLPTSKPFVEQEVNGRGLHEEKVGFPDVSPTHSTSTDSPTFLDHLPDLPEPPKCPGTPWKPKRDPEPLDTFNDFDLLDALQK